MHVHRIALCDKYTANDAEYDSGREHPKYDVTQTNILGQREKGYRSTAMRSHANFRQQRNL